MTLIPIPEPRSCIPVRGETPLDYVTEEWYDDEEVKQRKAAVAELLRSHGGVTRAGLVALCATQRSFSPQITKISVGSVRIYHNI